MDIFDIFIAYVSWGEGGKMGPVLILEQQEDTVHVFNITTQYETKSESVRSKYFKIREWQQAGLEKQSYVDTNVVRELPAIALAGKPKAGKLTENDVRDLIKFLAE